MLLAHHNFVLAKLVAVKQLFMPFGIFLSLQTGKLFFRLVQQMLFVSRNGQNAI